MLTLEQHLSAGYQFERHRAIGTSDPAIACADEIPRAALEIEAKRIAPLVQRDHVSKVRLAFLRRVLDLPSPSA